MCLQVNDAPGAVWYFTHTGPKVVDDGKPTAMF